MCVSHLLYTGSIFIFLKHSPIHKNLSSRRKVIRVVKIELITSDGINLVCDFAYLKNLEQQITHKHYSYYSKVKAFYKLQVTSHAVFTNKQ